MDIIRDLDETGRALDGAPIKAGDMFRINSGRVTTPYPKTRKRGSVVENQWLIDNTLAEARARGDRYGLALFSGEKPKFLMTASISLMLLYLFSTTSVLNSK